MLPRSLSASALKVAMSCQSRYYAENIRRGANIQGDAANLGITLHAALEKFILGLKIRKDISWDLDTLLALYDQAYNEIIGSDRNRPEYRDGKQILAAWFSRDYIFEDILGARTLSVESKNSFPVRVMYEGAVVEIQFNYIFDRLDQLGDEEFRVVDYKSNRFPLSVDELKDNIQARVYAVAVATKYKQAKKIWVEFDFLRHEKIGVVFTRDDNVETYRMIQREAQRIVDTDESQDMEERLNPECGWCVRKATCKTLASNVLVGGIMGMSLDHQARRFSEVVDAVRALTSLKNELEKNLILHAANNDLTEFDTDGTYVRISAYGRRRVNQDSAARILGPTIMAEYGGQLSVADVDEIEKRTDIPAGKKAALRSAIAKMPGNPTVKVKVKNDPPP